MNGKTESACEATGWIDPFTMAGLFPLSAPIVSTRLIDCADAERLAASAQTLAVVRHGSARAAGDAAAPCLDTGLELLAGPACELWET
ncbi:MAG TPA: hypothetical protein VFX38_05105, partial [Gammaproteobacteria bacterium]|nr:hypothetical protein [Gammaproteobacteria bacterium]